MILNNLLDKIMFKDYKANWAMISQNWNLLLVSVKGLIWSVKRIRMENKIEGMNIMEKIMIKMI